MTPEELNRRALSLLRKDHERDELVIVHTAQVADPASGETLYAFRAAAADAPGGPSWQIVLAADGSPRSPLPGTDAPGQTSGLAVAHAGPPITVQPGSNVLTLDPGQTFDETVTVTVPAGAGTGTPNVDIRNLKLAPSAGIAPLVVSIAPAAGYGPLAGDMQHVLKFAVRFRGVDCKDNEQVFTGTLDVVADGAVVAAKKVQVTIPACRARTVRYSVKFVCGTQDDACGCCTPVRHGQYATQISIHNYSQEPVTIRKRFIPLVLASAPLGREPKIGTSRAEDSIELPPHTATMDDCCRITELLFGAPVDALTIGLLEITATRDVSVTAVYTTASAIDVVQLTGQPA